MRVHWKVSVTARTAAQSVGCVVKLRRAEDLRYCSSRRLKCVDGWMFWCICTCAKCGPRSVLCGVLPNVHLVFPSSLGCLLVLSVVVFGCVVAMSFEDAALGFQILLRSA